MATGEEAVQSGAEHVELPREFIPLWCDPAVSSETFRPAIRYLARRGVRRSTCEATSVGACAEGRFAHRIVVPIEDDHGSLVGVVARTWGKGEPPYLNSSGLRRVLWNVAVLDAETDAPVLVVEGLFDALPHYPHAVACLGKPTHAHLDRLARSRRPVVMCLDGDARDEAWARAMQLRFYGVKTGVVLLDAGTDPNEYSTERLLRQAAESLRPGNL
jgi:DNA primase